MVDRQRQEREKVTKQQEQRWQREVQTRSARLPKGFVGKIVDAWSAYVDADGAKDLSDSFGVGSGGSGSRKNTAGAILRMRRDTLMAFKFLKRSCESLERKSQEKVFEDVANDEKVSVDTVKRAKRKYWEPLRRMIKKRDVPIAID